MTQRLRVMVVDDHPVVRKGIVAMLETEEDIHVVAECTSGVEAVSQAKACAPDVIVMDLVMPGMDGITAIQEIKKFNQETKILVLTSFSTSDKVFPSLNAGAIGYLLKDSEPTELIKAVRQVAKGEGSLHPLITRQVINQMSQSTARRPQQEEDLTDRETEVVRFIAQGLSNQDIAKELVVTEATVHSHVSKILTKLNLNNRTQIALYAIRKGIISIDPES